nr:MAG TPA: hypothetical protein [Caudoviricetes sp.]
MTVFFIFEKKKRNKQDFCSLPICYAFPQKCKPFCRGKIWKKLLKPFPSLNHTIYNCLSTFLRKKINKNFFNFF